MSLALLGEYMVASFSRRRSILRESKYPKDFIVPRYDPAQKAAARYLAHGARDQEQLLNDINEMLTGSSGSRWFQIRERLCQQATRFIMAIEAQLELEDLDIAAGNDPEHRMTIGGGYRDRLPRPHRSREKLVSEKVVSVQCPAPQVN